MQRTSDPETRNVATGARWTRLAKWIMERIVAVIFTGGTVAIIAIAANHELVATAHLSPSYSSLAAQQSPIKREADQGAVGESASIVAVTTGQAVSTATGSHAVHQIEFYVHNARAIETLGVGGAEAQGVEVTVDAAGGFISISSRSPRPGVTPQPWSSPDGFTGGVRIDRLSVGDEVALVASVLSVGTTPAETLQADGIHIQVKCQNCDGVVELD